MHDHRLNVLSSKNIAKLSTKSAASFIHTLENIYRMTQNNANYNLMKIYKSYEMFVIRAYKFRAVKLRLRIVVHNTTEKFL